MPRERRTRTVQLTRVTDHGSRKHVTLFFTFPGRGSGRSQVNFVKVEDVPPFEGETGWFEMEQVSARPWPYWRAIRQVDGPEPLRRKLAAWERLAAISAGAEEQRKLDADKP